jgi:hypothetical protein
LATNLAPSELYKYEWRVEKFLQKYKDKQPFELNDNSFVTLEYSDEIYNAILTKNNLEYLRSSFLVDSQGNKYRLSDLKKTNDLGGKGKEFSIRKEMQQIDRVNRQLEEIKLERLKKK